ncbi:MAG: pilus assembly FimT family protein [Gemmatimonadales bacterium]
MLVELVIAMAVVALLTLIAVQSLARVADAAAVREEVSRVVGAIDVARSAAVRLDATAALALLDTGYTVRARVGTDTVDTWHDAGPAMRGVRLAGAGAPIEFGPAGIAIGAANRTIVLTRGGARRAIVMSRLGRLTY